MVVSLALRRQWWRHQMETFSALLTFCAGTSPGTGNSTHKGQWRGSLMFYLICTWINSWVNNGGAGDLRPHRAYYDVTVIWWNQYLTTTKHNKLYIICILLGCTVTIDGMVQTAIQPKFTISRWHQYVIPCNKHHWDIREMTDTTQSTDNLHQRRTH